MTKKAFSLPQIFLNLLPKIVALLLPSYLDSFVLCLLSDPNNMELEVNDVLTNYLGTFADVCSSRDNAPPGFIAQDRAEDVGEKLRVSSDGDASYDMLTEMGSSRRVGKRGSADLTGQPRSPKKTHTASHQPLSRTETSEGHLASPNRGLEQRTLQKRPMDFDLNDPVVQMEEEVGLCLHATSQELAQLCKTHNSQEGGSKTAGMAGAEKPGPTAELKPSSTGKTLVPPSDPFPTTKAAFDLNFLPEDTPEAFTLETRHNEEASFSDAVPRVVDGRALTVAEPPNSQSDLFLQKDNERLTNVEIRRTASIAIVNHPNQTQLVELRAPPAQGSGPLQIHESDSDLNLRPKTVLATVGQVRTQAAPRSCFVFPASLEGLEVEIHEYPGDYESFRRQWLPCCHYRELKRPRAIQEAATLLGNAVLKHFGLESAEKEFIGSLKDQLPTSSRMCWKTFMIPTHIDLTIKMAMHKIQLILYDVFEHPLFEDPDEQKNKFKEAHEYVISYFGSLFNPKDESKAYTKHSSERSIFFSYQNRRRKAQVHFNNITMSGRSKATSDYNALAWAAVQDWMQTELTWVGRKMKGVNDVNRYFKCLVDDYSLALSDIEFEICDGSKIRFEFKKVYKIQNPPFN